MSVLIKGLIMPSCCDVCTFSDWSNLHQTASCKLHDYDPCFADYSREYMEKRADFCPLTEIPEPHGRLIDAEKLKKEYPHDTDWNYPVNTNCYVCESIDNAPTVIKAEGGESHDY